MPFQMKDNSISINKVEEVNISNQNTKENSKIRKRDIKKIKKIISEEYEITEENIEIN